MEINKIAKHLEVGLEKGATTSEVECEVTDTDRIYVAFADIIDAHDGYEENDEYSAEEYAFQQAEEYVKFLLNEIGVEADVELDCEEHNGNLWVYGDVIID